jgi:uroporphyrinogen III methyltransferase/synthase
MKRVLVTRPRSQADGFIDGLRVAGFEPICLPVIEIRPIENNAELDAALARLDEYAWIVFTSVNGVEVVLGRLPAVARFPRVAAIGPKTAQALRGRGIKPEFVPEEYVAESILPGLGDVRGKNILLPRAEIARKALPEAIRAAGGVADEIAVYRTLPAQPDAAALRALRQGVDWLTFTSPSTVENFVELTRTSGLDALHLPGQPAVACIGPITERAAREAGFNVAVVARDYTSEGLIQALKEAAARVDDL